MSRYLITVAGTPQATEVTYLIEDDDDWEGRPVANRDDAADLAYDLALIDPLFDNHDDLEVTFTETLND